MPAKEYLNALGHKVLPRILTQICRDPTSPLWGCCDRNWWHYKIRDFPSIILQQAGYAIALSTDALPDRCYSAELKALAAGTCQFWNQRALRYGAFEEYYPCEQGYPPVAFSTLAVAKLCNDGVIDLFEVRPGLEVAVQQLLSRFEMEAANQQAAGTAALAVIRKIAPDLVPDATFSTLLDRTLGLQTDEGWFSEYDGPDLGYLSVTIDCLWDIFDATSDKRCYTAILKAFEYLSWFVLGPVGGAGIHNARNTDYIVPYGITRLACDPGDAGGRAQAVLARLYGQNNDKYHFFDAVDDRYWCHYIGHSVFRAINILSTKDFPETISAERSVQTQTSMPESGHILVRGPVPSSPDVLMSMRKGGLFTALWPGGQRITDCGWIVLRGEKQYVSHWWSSTWKPYNQDNIVGCNGGFVLHREHVSTPWKHMALRVLSFFSGRRLSWLLKRLVIFKKKDETYTFCRRVRCEEDFIIVEDQISGLAVEDKLYRAPRSSKRHVASADNFHPDDLKMSDGVLLREEFHKKNGGILVLTRYEVQEKNLENSQSIKKSLE